LTLFTQFLAAAFRITPILYIENRARLVSSYQKLFYGLDIRHKIIWSTDQKSRNALAYYEGLSNSE